jgi:RNA polymerase sigma-70 factor, ECF subfamily
METQLLNPGFPPHLDELPNENERLLEAARQGDAQAFNELVAANQTRVVRQCMRRGLSQDEAVDIAQDVFLKVYRYRDRYTCQQAFSTWLYRIAENACIDHCRRRKRQQALIRPIPVDEAGSEAEFEGREPNPLASMEFSEQGSQLAAAFERLPAKLRQAFEFKELEGLRYSEIARRLSCTVGTVKSRIYRARQILVAELESAC